MSLEERITKLEAENDALREQVTVLAERLNELKTQLAKGSHNNSRPPSSNSLAQKTKSLRQRSGKKPDGRIGHWRQTLRLVVNPDEAVEHQPASWAWQSVEASVAWRH